MEIIKVIEFILTVSAITEFWLLFCIIYGVLIGE